MNCVQRRIFRVFVARGGDPNDLRQYAELMRLVPAPVLTLTGRSGQVLGRTLPGDERANPARWRPRDGP